MNLLELVFKPRIAQDSFKPVWLRKLYVKIVMLPCSLIYFVHAAVKYDGDMLQDQSIRSGIIALYNAGGEYRETVYKFFKFNEEMKEKAKEMKHNS